MSSLRQPLSVVEESHSLNLPTVGASCVAPAAALSPSAPMELEPAIIFFAVADVELEPAFVLLSSKRSQVAS